MNIGVTGAAGHIGAAVCHTLIQMGHEVTALVRQDKNAIQHLPIIFCQGNITEPHTLQDFMANCEVVIHTAATIDLGYNFDPKLYDINVKGTENVLRCAKEAGVKRVIHVSSIHAYNQHPQHEVLDEGRSFVTAPCVYYDITKREGHIAALKAATQGLEVVVVCPTSVIGPPDHKPSKMGKAIIDIYNGAIPAVFKGGFDFVDVRDVAKGIVSAVKNGKNGESYILSGQYQSIKALADGVLKIKGSRKQLREIPLAVAHLALPFIKVYASLTKQRPLYDKPYLDILQDGNAHISASKAAQDLGYNSRPLEETITDTIHWFKQHGVLK